MKRLMVGFLVVGLFSMVMGCSNEGGETGTNTESFGQLKLALDGCSPHYDVDGVRVKVFKDTTKDCGDVADVEKTTDLICVPDPIADALFVLPPGNYKVCAIPIKNTTTPPYYVPSNVCSTVFLSPVTIVAEVVKEITLTSICNSPNSSLDVITKFEDLTLLTGLTITPNKFISTCEKATITVTVDDPTVVNKYVWSITLEPLGSGATLIQPDSTKPWIAEFSTPTPGDYQVQVDVTNPAGNKASFKEIPIHVRWCCDDATGLLCPVGQVCCDHLCKDGTICVKCGDGFVTPPETCDKAIQAGNPGACPASCDDGDFCTIDKMTGTAATCDVTCDHSEEIVDCKNDDGCCPHGCTILNDNNCPG